MEGLGQFHIWRFGLGPVVQHRELERVGGRADAFPQRPAPVQLRPDTLGGGISALSRTREGVWARMQRALNARTAADDTGAMAVSWVKLAGSP